MINYIWQKSNWTAFLWQSETLLIPLGRARRQQGCLQTDAEYIGLEQQATILTEETIQTAAIEGELIARDAVRSSVARRLGLPTAGLQSVDRHADGLVEVLLDATGNYRMGLDSNRLKAWHAALFPTGYSGMVPITVADWRIGDQPMQVVSGPIGKERVHYLAPPAEQIHVEMVRFFKWWRNPPENLDGLVRAAIAHFWFVTIHPFDDGNGRIARAITDMALAQDEGSGRRLYSMSSQIMDERKTYYSILERTQKGSGDLTDWIVWFLSCFERTVGRSRRIVKKTLQAARLWQTLASIDLNERQRKVINKLVEVGPGKFEGGLTNKKYVGMTRTSRETAKRDITDLVKKGILLKNRGRGRSTSYRLNFDK